MMMTVTLLNLFFFSKCLQIRYLEKEFFKEDAVPAILNHLMTSTERASDRDVLHTYIQRKIDTQKKVYEGALQKEGGRRSDR